MRPTMVAVVELTPAAYRSSAALTSGGVRSHSALAASRKPSVKNR
jgi:hypothetical protein